MLLSNGEPVASGPGWAEWRDPWPKPSYLFALVAGDLRAQRDRFVTRSGREVDLAIWTRPGPDEGRCAFAMDALIRAMRWDEEAYGREYDLPVFNVVAVSDFNMGAMENKGLNIFNSSAVLASPETATDADFERIEAIVAHEYFHNWTGNRITCRDWFQLCLKEGLTVFRDQQFTAHERSAAVARIQDVIRLRGRQFREDAGPLAHPVRPESFFEINNFYTATVYEKGAELVGMLRVLVGPEGYDAALQLYFERHDGQACTVEDWLAVFEDATGRDLAQFKRWYEQAGTPRIAVTEAWTPAEAPSPGAAPGSGEGAAGPAASSDPAAGLASESGPGAGSGPGATAPAAADRAAEGRASAATLSAAPASSAIAAGGPEPRPADGGRSPALRCPMPSPPHPPPRPMPTPAAPAIRQPSAPPPARAPPHPPPPAAPPARPRGAPPRPPPHPPSSPSGSPAPRTARPMPSPPHRPPPGPPHRSLPAPPRPPVRARTPV